MYTLLPDNIVGVLSFSKQHLITTNVNTAQGKFVGPSYSIYFFLFYIFIFIYLFEYETIVRSSASSFGHSGPDPGSVKPLE